MPITLSSVFFRTLFLGPHTNQSLKKVLTKGQNYENNIFFQNDRK